MPKPSSAPLHVVKLERTFNAPVALVFEAWTTPELWAQWFPPRGFEMKIEKMAFQEGGDFAAAFHGHGMVSEFAGTYTEIVPNERLVWSFHFPDGPVGQATTTVTFHPQGQQTLLKVEQGFFNLEGIAEQAIEGAPQGWGETLDKLGELLAKRAA